MQAAAADALSDSYGLSKEARRERGAINPAAGDAKDSADVWQLFFWKYI